MALDLKDVRGNTKSRSTKGMFTFEKPSAPEPLSDEAPAADKLNTKAAGNSNKAAGNLNRAAGNLNRAAGNLNRAAGNLNTKAAGNLNAEAAGNLNKEKSGKRGRRFNTGPGKNGLTILQFIEAHNRTHGANHNVPIRLDEISLSTGIKRDSLKFAIKTLKRLGYLESVRSLRTKGSMGTIYRLPEKGLQELVAAGNLNAKAAGNLNARSSSSSILRSTTTTPELHDFQMLEARIQHLGQTFSAQDLRTLWQRTSGVRGEFGQFVRSAEALAGYIASERGQGIKNLVGFAVRELEANGGCYLPPVGFVSFEKHQENLKLKALEKRRQKRAEFEAELEALVIEQAALEFEGWRLTMSDAALQRIAEQSDPELKDPNAMAHESRFKRALEEHHLGLVRERLRSETFEDPNQLTLLEG